MDESIAKKAIDFFIDNLASKKDEVRIIFVGGEVLTEFNLLKNITAYALKKASSKVNLKFSLDTNATLITPEICDFLKKNSFFVMTSLDYPEESHNAHRFFKNTSRGDYQLVLNKIKLVLKLLGRDYLSVRATINHDNIDKLSEYVDTMISLGIKHIDFAPNYEVPWREKDLSKFASQIRIIKNNYNPKNITIKILERFIKNEPVYPYGHPCGVMLTVNVDGEFFPCTRFVNIAGFSFGNVNDAPSKILLKLEDYCNLLKNAWKDGTFVCPANNYLINQNATKKSIIFKQLEKSFWEGSR